MRTVKVNFIDYWGDFNRNIDDYLIIKLLRKHFNVIVCDDADYVFFSSFGETHWGVSDSCINIFHTGENMVPDFNACDYAFGFEWMEYEDRYIRFPLYLFYSPEILHRMEHKHELPEGWDLNKEKPDFCSFVVSNHRNPKRKIVFDELSKYKHVDSGGKYLNNVGGPVADKLAFESTHKFSICYENGAHNGYTPEKLIQAFAARTIPIYWGDPKVGDVFNTNSFINANDYPSIDAVVDRVKQLDTNKELYLKMLRQPAMLPTHPSVDAEIAKFEKWLISVFEQPLEKAYRRNRELHGRWYIDKRLKLDILANRRAIIDMSIRKIKEKHD